MTWASRSGWNRWSTSTGTASTLFHQGAVAGLAKSPDRGIQARPWHLGPGTIRRWLALDRPPERAGGSRCRCCTAARRTAGRPGRRPVRSRIARAGTATCRAPGTVPAAASRAQPRQQARRSRVRPLRVLVEAGGRSRCVHAARGVRPSRGADSAPTNPGPPESRVSIAQIACEVVPNRRPRLERVTHRISYALPRSSSKGASRVDQASVRATLRIGQARWCWRNVVHAESRRARQRKRLGTAEAADRSPRVRSGPAAWLSIPGRRRCGWPLPSNRRKCPGQCSSRSAHGLVQKLQNETVEPYCRGRGLTSLARRRRGQIAVEQPPMECRRGRDQTWAARGWPPSPPATTSARSPCSETSPPPPSHRPRLTPPARPRTRPVPAAITGHPPSRDEADSAFRRPEPGTARQVTGRGGLIRADSTRFGGVGPTSEGGRSVGGSTEEMPSLMRQ